MRARSVAAIVTALLVVGCADDELPAPPDGEPPATTAVPSPSPSLPTSPPTPADQGPSPSPRATGDARPGLSFVERSGARDGRASTLVLLDPVTGEREERPLDIQQDYAWAPDGERIAYLPPSTAGPSARDVHVWRLGDEEAGAPLRSSPGSDDLEVAWSPAGDLLAIARRPVGATATNVVAVASDGSDEHQLTDADGDTDVFSLDWSPDGEEVAYRRIDRSAAGRVEDPDPDADGIHIVDRDGGEEREVVTDLFDEMQPAWSPDGAWIAFAAREQPDPHPFRLYVARPDGSGRRVVADVEVHDRIAWSPAGDRVAVSVGRLQEPSDIHVIDVDTGATTATVDARRNDIEPVWSPDGERIAFLGFVGPEGESDLFVVAADGSDPEQLTDHGRVSSPAFRPTP